MLKNIVLTGGIGDLLWDALKTLTFGIDHAIYWLVGIVYQVFYKLAGFNILNTESGETVLTNITNRIYVILGIVMIFVLAFNLLNYIIDPDKIKDKKVGASTFIKDVVITLVIISVLGTVFDKLYAFQWAVINDGTIFNLVLGGNTSLTSNKEQNTVEQGAGIMIATVYSAFLRPITIEGEEPKTALDCNKKDISGSFKDYCDAYEASKSGYGIDAFQNFITNKDFEFTPGMTTIAGIGLLIFMVMFCFQLAKRVGKLLILQLIAPVPLALEILPNKKGSRKKWFETLLKVYLDAFIYLVIVTFIVLLISLIPAAISGLWEAPGELGLIASIILIFGLLMFAKEAPAMLLDLLGIKSTSLIKDSWAMTKKGGAMGAFLGGTLGSAVGSGISNIVHTKGALDVSKGRNGFTRFLRGTGNAFYRAGSGVAGTASSLTHNIMGARNVHTISDANNLRRRTSQTVANRRINRDAYAAAHGGFLGSIGGHFSDLGSDISHAARGFVGLNANNNNPELEMLDRLQNQFKDHRANENNDARYAEQRQLFNEQAGKDNAFVKGYNKFISDPKNAGKNYQDYFNHLKSFSTATPAERSRYSAEDQAYLRSSGYAQLSAVQQNMESRKDSIIKNKVDQQRADIQKMKVILESTPQLRELADKDGKLYDRIGEVLKDNGEFITTRKDASGAEVPIPEAEQRAAVNKLIEDYNRAIIKRKNEINIATASERAREEQRQARRNNNKPNDKK